MSAHPTIEDPNALAITPTSLDEGVDVVRTMLRVGVGTADLTHSKGQPRHDEPHSNQRPPSTCSNTARWVHTPPKCKGARSRNTCGGVGPIRPRPPAGLYDLGMRIGVSITSAHAVDDPAVGVTNMIERTRAARDAGLDSLSLGDHHATLIPYYQGVPMLGRLSAEWDTTRPTGCLFLLPLWHPVLVAEQIGVLASMCNGTFVVQTGIGGGDRQFRAMGADLSGRGRDFDESIRIIKALLAGETVRSRQFGIRDAVVNPVPAGRVEWWIGAGEPGPLRRAAREGDAWYGSPGIVAADAPRMLDTYRTACDAQGREPRAIVRRDVIVLRDADRARELGDRLVEAGYRGIPRRAVAYGGVEDVAEQLAPFRDLGFSDVIVRAMTIEQDEAVETLTLCGEVQRLLT